MRKEPFVVGDFVHLIRRGGRGLPIVKNESDRWRYLKCLYFLNNNNSGVNVLRDFENYSSKTKINNGKGFFSWPQHFSPRVPLCKILAFTLLDNHDHIIAMETEKDGISKFMHKTGISLSKYHNEKYKEKGSLFQGAYKARRIDTDAYLMQVIPYVMVKNTFEMHPKGYLWAVKNFEDAWEWATRYPFSSLGDYTTDRNSPIVDAVELKKMIGGRKDFKVLCKDMIGGRLDSSLIDVVDDHDQVVK